MISVLLGAPDEPFATSFAEVLAESSDLQLVGAAGDGSQVVEAIGRVAVDVVCIHEGLGPISALDVARDISTRAPDAALVLLTRSVTTETLRQALQAGFRGVARLPLSLEDLGAAIRQAGSWAHSVRSRLSGEEPAGSGGHVITLTGAKGGVGTTTVAVHLARLAATGSHAEVCLVDLDLQTGDIRSLLGITDTLDDEVDRHGPRRRRRSIADLALASEELTPRQIDESMHHHSSGVRVLLCPPDGEDAEDIRATPTRRVLGALRRRFDLVIIDAGSVITEAASVAIEVADDVVVVCTPDVPAMRGANRQIEMWQRMRFRSSGIVCVVNRAGRDREIQPDTVSRVVVGPVADTIIPSDFARLEAPLNTGDPNRLDGPVADALLSLAQELGMVRPRRARPRRRLRGLDLRATSGQAAVETLGLVPVVVLVIVALWQMALVGYTQMLGSHAAAEGARALSLAHHRDASATVSVVGEAVREDLPAPWVEGVQVRIDASATRVAVSLPVPLLLPSWLELPTRVTSERGATREGRARVCPAGLQGWGQPC